MTDRDEETTWTTARTEPRVTRTVWALVVCLEDSDTDVLRVVLEGPAAPLSESSRVDVLLPTGASLAPRGISGKTDRLTGAVIVATFDKTPPDADRIEVRLTDGGTVLLAVSALPTRSWSSSEVSSGLQEDPVAWALDDESRTDTT